MGVTLVLVKAADPFGSVISPAAKPRFQTTPPATPAAPGWICAPVKVVPAGNPDSVTVKSAVAAVTLPDASFVGCTVTVTVPLPVTSPPTTAVVSFPGKSVAVNFGSAAGVGVAGLSLPQPVAASVSPRATADRYKRGVMCKSSRVRSVEFPREVESQTEIVRLSTACDLRERRPSAIGEVQLKHVAAGALFDREAVLRFSRGIASEARRYFCNEVDSWAESETAADAQIRRVAVETSGRRGVVHPHGHCVHGQEVAEGVRDADADGRGELLLEIIRPLDRHDRRGRERRRVVL